MKRIFLTFLCARWFRRALALALSVFVGRVQQIDHPFQ
jgi:hypothetical protein